MGPSVWFFFWVDMTIPKWGSTNVKILWNKLSCFVLVGTYPYRWQEIQVLYCPTKVYPVTGSSVIGCDKPGDSYCITHDKPGGLFKCWGHQRSEKSMDATGPINMFQKAKTTWPIKRPCKNTTNHCYEVEALGVCSTCWKRQVMVLCVQCPSPWMKHLKKAGNINLKKWSLSFKTHATQTNEREAELH